MHDGDQTEDYPGDQQVYVMIVFFHDSLPIVVIGYGYQ